MLYQRSQVKQIKQQSLNRQRGVVIVVALFMVALIAVMSFSMMARFERDTRRTLLIFRHVEAAYYAEGSLAWAMDQLRNNWEQQKKNQLIDKMPLKADDVMVNHYHIVSKIYDMQARFNINLLPNLDRQNDFLRLLKILDKELPENKARQITQAVFDWITPIPQENEFTKYYLQLPAPYRAAHRPMMSVSELRLVKGMTPELYNLISPYLSALPETAFINVQTAPLPILMTLSPKMNEDNVKKLIKQREQHPFVSKDDLKTLPRSWEVHDQIVTVSKYFLVETIVTIENQRLALYTLLERIPNEDKASVKILWQSKGVA